MDNNTLIIADNKIKPGEDKYIYLPSPALYTGTQTDICIRVIHSRKPGPILFIVSTIHGDEINGIDIIRRLLQSPELKQLHGTLITMPIANPYGFLNKTREMPDHRDLNRFFPGNPEGPLASRVANLIVEEIAKKCDVVIDLHTGRDRRRNLPQLRVYLDQPGVQELAESFKAPVIVDAAQRDGSLRATCRMLNIPSLCYEAGEALRFTEFGIRVGHRGLLYVMDDLKMIPAITKSPELKNMQPVIAHSTLWIRSPNSGILKKSKQIGFQVKKGDILATVTDPFGNNEKEVRCPIDGVIIGINNLPLINAGDALFHIGCFESAAVVSEQIDELYSFVD